MSRKDVVIIDYGVGNLRSLRNAFAHLGVAATLSADHKEIMESGAVILPGVGAFGFGMSRLRERDLIGTLNEYVSTGKKMMGICLGMQLFFDTGFENGEQQGLGFIEGSVQKIPLVDSSRMRLPHIGWRSLEIQKESENLRGLTSENRVYFVHSYRALPTDRKSILTITKYEDVEIVSSVEHENIAGYQFHPEKSGKTGLKILSNFLRNI